MEKKEIEKKLDEFGEVLSDLSNKLDISAKTSRLKELDNIMSDSSFWSTSNTSDIISEAKNIRSIVDKYNTLFDSVSTLKEMIGLELSESDLEDIVREVKSLETNIDELKLSTFLNGEFDSNNAYVEIHSGAGGTESNDWASMLFRMYTRFFEKNDYKYEVISKQDGEEVGLKGVVLLVKGY